MATLLSFNLRPQGETFNEDGAAKEGQRVYIAKYDGPVNNINDYESIPGLPAMFSTWDMATHSDVFVNSRGAEYKDPGSRSILIVTVGYSSTDENGRDYGTLLAETFTKQGGVQSGSRTYKVSPNPADAAEAIEEPVIPDLNTPWSSNRPGVLVVSHDADKRSDGTYTVVANYQTTDETVSEEKSENPLREPAIYKYSSIAQQVDTEFDVVTGERIKYTNGRPVLPLRKTIKDIGVWTITRNEPQFSQLTAGRFRSSTNKGSGQVDGDNFPEDTLYIKSINADPFWDQDGYRYFKVVYVVYYHEDGFKDMIANADTRDKDGYQYPLKTGYSDKPIALDTNGEFIDGDVSQQDQIILEPNIYKQSNFNQLGL